VTSLLEQRREIRSIDVRRWMVVALVFLLPLHTVFVPAGISWKPFLLILFALIVWDASDGIRDRRWPWNARASVAAGVLLVATTIGWSGLPEVRGARLWFALLAGTLLLLVVERSLREFDLDRPILRAVAWSAAVMAATAAVLSFAIVGTFGAGVIESIDNVPGIDRVGKATYLTEGFVALTNWHQDPGYAAAWMNLWAALVMAAWARGWAFGRWWLSAAVIGGLGAGTFMTMSRTGWLGFVVAIGAAALFLHFREHVPWLRLLRLLGVAVAVGVLLVAAFWVADRPGIGTDLAEAVDYRLSQGASLGAPIEGFVDEGFGVQDTRSVVWPRYVNAYQTHPVSGIGLGVGWATPNMQEPHNLGLQLLGETGLVGLLAFAAVAYVVLRWGGGTVGAIALVVVASTAMTQTVLFEPTLWFSGALYLGKAGVDRSNLRSSDA
jgi:hypothetical protein